MGALCIAEEAYAYLSWFEELQRSLKPRQGVVSQLYRSHLVTAYSRHSLLKAVVRGAPSICIADISVAQPGQGFFSALCDRFEAVDCPAHASALFVENVSNHRFASWLALRGFLVCPYSHPAMPSLYLVRARPAGIERD